MEVELSSTSFVFGDVESLVIVPSSASILSSREDLRLMVLFEVGTVAMAVVVFTLAGSVMTLSKRAVSLGAAIAFNCFPRLSIVSWHSANFSEAAVISHSCKHPQV